MFERRKIQSLDDFFAELGSRRERGVYFYRINGYNDQVKGFLMKYYEAARLSGVVIEGKIPNPDKKNLTYYEEIMGMDFRMNLDFITGSLKKWLPRMNDVQRENVASSMYCLLDSLRKKGKNDAMLKNAYIKFMCWLYYKFERIVNRLGENKVPKILYEGEVSQYELLLTVILSNAGCDVVLLQYKGDLAYQKLDPGAEFSDCLNMPGMMPFPDSFSLKQIRQELDERAGYERLYGQGPQMIRCTNAWIKGKPLEDIRTDLGKRGNDPKLFYNCFCRINGVEDKLIYLNELYRFYLEIKNSGRRVLVLDQGIAPPAPEEIDAVRRGRYASRDQMMLDLSKNIQYAANRELQRIMVNGFVDVIRELSGEEGMNLNKLSNKAVYLICWLKRYQSFLFSNWKPPEIGLCICMGGCRNDNEALFFRFLSRLPADVLILAPNLNEGCCLKDKYLYEVHYQNSLNVKRFPRENTDVHMGTAAYHAERELDAMMYQDSGMYRNQQYKRASAITLQTMYEEIALLWNQELKYRPNFSTVDDVVNLPVIFAKVSGVRNGGVQEYWQGIKRLLGEDTILVKRAPYISETSYNPVQAHCTAFFKNGRLLKETIKSHACYQYGYLRDEMQNHLLDKLQQLIEQRIIKGTFETGVEYKIIGTVLNMDRNILRLIQKFDFTKKNPKLVYINTTERIISLEDAILMAYLNFVGFDIVFFVPTGYMTVERYYHVRLMEEHQIGEYMYDLPVPDFSALPSGTYRSWREIIFKRGT